MWQARPRPPLWSPADQLPTAHPAPLPRAAGRLRWRQTTPSTAARPRDWRRCALPTPTATLVAERGGASCAGRWPLLHDPFSEPDCAGELLDSPRLAPRLPEISRSPAAQASRSATKTCPSPSRSPTASRACARFGRTSCCPRCWTAPDASSATPARDYPRLPQRLPGIRLQLSRRRPCQRAARLGGVRAAERRRREPSVARAPQRLTADIRARARRWRVRWPLHMSRTRP